MNDNALSSIIHSRTAWSDYFPGTNPSTTLVTNEYTSTQTLSGTNVYVSNCLFNECSSSSNGGALYCSSVTCLLIESSSFFSCKTSNTNGGAFYFQNSNNGQCILNKVCGYDCCSTYTSSSSYDMFARMYLNSDQLGKNYVNYSSISRCVTDNSNSQYALLSRHGNICYKSLNLSMNKCGSRVIYYYPSTDSNSVTGSLLYSTFADNIAIICCFICLGSGGIKYEIKSCNFLRNTQPLSNTGEGTIATYRNTIIEDSCILENKAYYVLYISSSSYTVTLSNCTVDPTSSNGNLITHKTVTKSFILALNHISTQNCHSNYDSAGTLTPIIIQTPSSSKKQIQCFTIGNFLCRPQVSDVFSLIILFFFNFIHSY
jgi:hypothetical protein